jgi:hypothetical protein
MEPAVPQILVIGNHDVSMIPIPACIAGQREAAPVWQHSE